MDAAILEVVRTGFSISQDAAVSGALESLGFGRVTTNIASVMNTRVASLLKTKQLARQDEKLVVTQSV